MLARAQTLLLAVCLAPAALAQDECLTAVPIAIGSAQTPFDTTTATSSGAWTCAATSAPDVWFSVTPQADGLFSANVIGAAAVEVHEGPCGSGVVVGCAEGINAAGFTQTRVPFAASAGVTYSIRVAVLQAGGGSSSMWVWERPHNDDCEFAEPLVVGVPVMPSTFRSARSNEAWSCLVGGAFQERFDVWYSYTATATEALSFDLCGTIYTFSNARVELYEGTCASRTSIECVERTDGCGGYELAFQAIAGRDYLLRVAPYSNSTSTVVLNRRPSNDDCADAAPITLGSHPVSTRGAEYEPSPGGCGIQPVRDVWFEVVPTSDGYLDVVLDQTNFDTRLAAFFGTCGATQLLDCVSAGAGDPAAMEVLVTAGVPVLVQVASQGSEAGEGTLHLSLDSLSGGWGTESYPSGRDLVRGLVHDGTVLTTSRRVSGGFGYFLDVRDPSTGAWTSVAKGLPPWAAAGSAGDRLVFATGPSSINTLEVEVFDTQTWTYTTGALPVGRNGIATYDHAGKIYFAGGFTVGNTALRIDVYDTATDTWSTSALPVRRGGAAATVVDDKAYLVGGGLQFLSAATTMLVHDLTLDAWSQVPLPYTGQSWTTGPRELVAHGDRILFVDWRSTGWGVLHVYDTGAGAWSTIAVPDGRTGYGIEVLGDELFLLGGFQPSGDPMNSVAILDLASSTWRTEIVQVSASGPTAVTSGERLFVVPQQSGDPLATYASPLTTSECAPAVPNATGRPAEIFAYGSSAASDNDLRLFATDMPFGSVGYFLVGNDPTIVQPSISAGPICVGGMVGRYSAAAQVFAGPIGRLDLDLTALPTTPNVAVLAGQTWRFQAWFRDPVQGSNLSNAVAVMFD